MNKNTIKAPCTVLLAVVNVIVFLVLSFSGNDGGWKIHVTAWSQCMFHI